MRWFDNQTRGLKILQVLERKISVSPAVLSDRLKVSPRTIKNEIGTLNSILGQSARIELKSGNYHLYRNGAESPFFNEVAMFRKEGMDSTRYGIPWKSFSFYNIIQSND